MHRDDFYFYKLSVFKNVAETTPNSRGQILGRNPDKSRSSFPPCYSQSLIALPWYFYFFKFTQPVTVSSSTVHLLYTIKKKGGQPYLPMGYENHTETSSLRTLKIMHRNLQNCMFMNSAIGFLRLNSWSNWDKTKSLKSFPPFYPQSPPLHFLPHLSKSDLKLVCNVNIVYWKTQVRELSRLC